MISENMQLIHKQFYFIRHGQTDWNEKGIIMGRSDIPLNQTGISQAQQAKTYVKGIGLDHIYASPLSRAYRTAEIINEELNLPLIKVDGLMEWSVGEMEGNSKEALRARIESNQLPKDAQAWDDFKDQVLNALHEVLSSDVTMPLIVSHGGCFKVLINELAQQQQTIANCELFLFQPPAIVGEKWSVRTMNKEN